MHNLERRLQALEDRVKPKSLFVHTKEGVDAMATFFETHTGEPSERDYSLIGQTWQPKPLEDTERMLDVLLNND